MYRPSTSCRHCIPSLLEAFRRTWPRTHPLALTFAYRSARIPLSFRTQAFIWNWLPPGRFDSRGRIHTITSSQSASYLSPRSFGTAARLARTKRPSRTRRFPGSSHPRTELSWARSTTRPCPRLLAFVASLTRSRIGVLFAGLLVSAACVSTRLLSRRPY